MEMLAVHPKLLASGYGMLVALNLGMGVHLSERIRGALQAPLGEGESYYGLVTFHGLVMIFMYLMPVLYGVLGNALCAHGSGVSDMLFPRLNILGLQTIAASTVLVWYAVGSGAPYYCGWVLTPPISLVSGLELLILGLHLSGISSVLTSLNLLLTTNLAHRLHRTNGEMPLLFASINTGNVLVLLSLPVLAGGITLLLLDKAMGTLYYAQQLGGDLLLYQHLFWFFGHPEVYILVLPCFGLMSFQLAFGLGRTPVNGYNMTLALMTICYISCAVWGHHLYTVQQAKEARDFFAWATLLIGVPTGIKYFSWLAGFPGVTGYTSVQSFSLQGFMYMFFWGGMGGIVLGNSGLDLAMHDTYYVVGHFHLIMAAAVTYVLYTQLSSLVSE